MGAGPPRKRKVEKVFSSLFSSSDCFPDGPKKDFTALLLLLLPYPTNILGLSVEGGGGKSG